MFLSPFVLFLNHIISCHIRMFESCPIHPSTPKKKLWHSTSSLTSVTINSLISEFTGKFAANPIFDGKNLGFPARILFSQVFPAPGPSPRSRPLRRRRQELSKRVSSSRNFSSSKQWVPIIYYRRTSYMYIYIYTHVIHMCVYTVITNGFSSVYCACTIIKRRGQRCPCHFLCQRSWVTCGKDIGQGRLIYVPAIVSTCFNC